MVTPKEILLEIIEKAICEEIKARNFFKKLAPQMKLKGSQLKLEVMASTEDAHREFLIRWYKEIGGKEPNLAMDIRESFTADILQKDASLEDILEIIIRCEDRAYNYYKKASETVSDMEVRGIFESLATMEKEHRDFFRDEYRVVSEVSLRFAEEEIPWMMEM